MTGLYIGIHAHKLDIGEIQKEDTHIYEHAYTYMKHTYEKQKYIPIETKVEER